MKGAGCLRGQGPHLDHPDNRTALTRRRSELKALEESVTEAFWRTRQEKRTGIRDRRWAQVPMSSNKFTSCSRKRQEGFKSANDPSDVAILGMAVDSQSLFRRSVPRLLPRRENEPAEAAAIEATSRHGEQHSISIGTMDFREASPLKFLLIPATFWHRLARCKLTKPRLEGYFTNACAVWTT